MVSERETPVLIVMADPDIAHAVLQRRFPDFAFLPVRDVASLRAALEQQPQIAFSVKSRELDEGVFAVLREAESLRWLHVGGSGYDHLLGPDGAPWDDTRLAVSNSAGVLASFLADTCMAAILALNQNLFRYEAARKARHWKPLSFRPLAGQKLLIIGTGAIGSSLAIRAKAFGLHVVGLRRELHRAVEGVDEMHPPEALFEQLERADIVSLHLRLSAATQGLFNADAFDAMKPGVLFLNTARGKLVVERDLLAALESGHVGAAYLDVFEQEPLPQDNPLWSAENVVLSHHSADQVQDWEIRFTELFADNLERWRSGQPLLNRVRL